MRNELAGLLIVVAGLGSAYAQPAEELARLPRPRPDLPANEVGDWASSLEERFRKAAVADVDADADVEDAMVAIEGLAPLPRPRPASSEPAVLALVGPQRLPSIPVPVEADDPDCPARLETMGVTFTKEPPIAEGECTVARPLKVSVLGSGVSIEPEAILSCRAAESLAGWVEDALVPAAHTHFGVAPTGIVHGSTYVCRPRNNVAGAKLSEHAHANAIDIASIRFPDRTVGIGTSDPETPEAEFENEIRTAACDQFTTVLGPGSDAAHALHLHFDMALRRGGYRLCDLGAPTVALTPENTKRE